jgi:hypothetical protein
VFVDGLSWSLSPKIDNPGPPLSDKKLNGIIELNINAEENNTPRFSTTQSSIND